MHGIFSMFDIANNVNIIVLPSYLDLGPRCTLYAALITEEDLDDDLDDDLDEDDHIDGEYDFDGVFDD